LQNQPIFYLLLAISLAIGVWAYFATRAKSQDSSNMEPAPPPKPTSGQAPRNLGLGIGIVVICGLLAAFTSWCNGWHWTRHPPTQEHRQELLEVTSKQFHCPIDQLVVSPEGEIGAKVTGCGGETHLCWRQPARLWKFSWLPCE
jgi:hypothetical protein